MTPEELRLEEQARQQLEHARWKGHVTCPFCASDRTGFHKPSQQHRCHTCKHYFSVRTKTIMAHSKLPLYKWVKAIRIYHEYPHIDPPLLGTFLSLPVKTSEALLEAIRNRYPHPAP